MTTSYRTIVTGIVSAFLSVLVTADGHADWHRVFLTGNVYSLGNFGDLTPGVGRHNADYECTFAAFDAGYIPDWDGLRIDYFAFLSDYNGPIINARDRFTIEGQVINTNGDVVWESADVFPEAPSASFGFDEFGIPYAGPAEFWSGSTGSGDSASDCDGWTVDTGTAVAGDWQTGSIGGGSTISCKSAALSFLCISKALPSEHSFLPGDFNEDGVVDGADFLLWQREGADEAALADWLGSFGSPLTPLSPLAAGAVPEPAAALLALAALALPSFARRR